MTADEVPDPPGLPEGRSVELPGRGTTFVRRLAGPEGAPTVVLLHGWTVNAALNWFAVFEPLAEHVHVVALDHRGHGRGIRTWRRFRLEDCADDVVALADQLGIDRIIPVGYSMGGPIAQLVWRRHPDRVDGLVLCATSRTFGTRGAGGRAMASMAGMASLIVRATPRRVQRTLGGRLLDARFDQSDLGRWARQQVIQNDTRMVVEAGPGPGRVLVAGTGSAGSTCRRPWSSPSSTRRCRPTASADWPRPSPTRPCIRSPATTGSAARTPTRSSPGCSTACTSVVERARGGARRRQAG